MHINGVLSLCICIAMSTISFGQTTEPQAPQGINIVAAGGSAPDEIDLNALTNILGIPIRNKAGRGIPFEATYQYNSQITVINHPHGTRHPPWGGAC